MPNQQLNEEMVDVMRRSTALGVLVLLAISLSHCTGDPAPLGVQAEEVSSTGPIARAIAAHGMEELDSASIGFMFRDYRYSIETRGGAFRYTRQFTDSVGQAVLDDLTNEGLQRYVDGAMVELTAKDSAAYAGSVNSVRYFFMLPYVLNDAAVVTRALDTILLDGEPYDQLEVRFQSTGGGEDFEDVYRYYFSQRTGEMGYLAYSFDVNAGGVRFRRAINKRRIGGVLVQDYENYGIDGEDRDLDSIATRYTAGALPLLSLIENTEVTVQTGGRE